MLSLDGGRDMGLEVHPPWVGRLSGLDSSDEGRACWEMASAGLTNIPVHGDRPPERPRARLGQLLSHPDQDQAARKGLPPAVFEQQTDSRLPLLRPV